MQEKQKKIHFCFRAVVRLAENITKVLIIITQSLSRIRFFVTRRTAACQASLSFTSFWRFLKLISTESVMPSSHLIFYFPFSSCPRSYPASGSFPMSQLFAWGGQSIGVSASASFLLKNTQDWSPLEWTGWISLQSKGLSRVFSNTTVRKHSEILIHTPKNLPI